MSICTPLCVYTCRNLHKVCADVSADMVVASAEMYATFMSKRGQQAHKLDFCALTVFACIFGVKHTIFEICRYTKVSGCQLENTFHCLPIVHI